MLVHLYKKWINLKDRGSINGTNTEQKLLGGTKRLPIQETLV